MMAAARWPAKIESANSQFLRPGLKPLAMQALDLHMLNLRISFSHSAKIIDP